MVRAITVLLMAVVLAACGSARPHVDGPGLSGWESQMLGAKPDAYFVLRMDKALADPVYGGPRTPFDPSPLRAQDPELEAFMRSVSSVEGWVVADALARKENTSMLLVVRGRPSLEWARRQESAQKLKWRAPERLPSGALFYDLSDSGTPGALVVLPSGTWVAVAGAITPRVRHHFFGTSADPPPSSYERDALLAIWVGPGVTRLSKHERSPASLEGGALVIRSSAKGDVELTASFFDEKDAEHVTAQVLACAALLPTIRRELANECPAWEKVDFDIHRDGRTVTGRMANLPPLVQAYRTGACRYEDARRVFK